MNKQLKNCIIIVKDDDAVILKLIGCMLKSLKNRGAIRDYRLSSVKSQLMAEVERCQVEGVPVLVLLDYSRDAEDWNGLETLGELWATYPEMPAAVVTATHQATIQALWDAAVKRIPSLANRPVTKHARAKLELYTPEKIYACLVELLAPEQTTI